MNFIDDQGIERSLGNISPAYFAAAHPIYGDAPTQPMISRSEWPKIVAALGNGPDAWYTSPVHDQSVVSMCNASATTSAHETARYRLGLPLVKLSGGDLYHRISGGRDQGSTLEDGLREASTNGMASVDVVPYLDWRGNHGQAAIDDRKRFVVLEYCLLPTFDHCFSAVAEGFDLISGVLWFNNYKPDSDGWLPARGVGNTGGHAVHGYKPAMRNGHFGIWHKNSWTPSWGLQGKCVFPEEAYGSQIGGWWGIRSVVREATDIPAPKEAA